MGQGCPSPTECRSVFRKGNCEFHREEEGGRQKTPEGQVIREGTVSAVTPTPPRFSNPPLVAAMPLVLSGRSTEGTQYGGRETRANPWDGTEEEIPQVHFEPMEDLRATPCPAGEMPEYEEADEEIPRQTIERTATQGTKEQRVGGATKQQKKKKGKPGPKSKHGDILGELIRRESDSMKKRDEALMEWSQAFGQSVETLEKKIGLKLEATARKVLQTVSEAVRGTRKNPEKKGAKGGKGPTNQEKKGGSQETGTPGTSKATPHKGRGLQEINQVERKTWAQVVGQKYWPKNESELAKANKKGPVQTKPARDLRVFLRFGENIPDEVVTDRKIREVMGDSKGIRGVSRTNRALAVACKGPMWQGRLLEKREEIIQVTGCTGMEIAEK